MAFRGRSRPLSEKLQGPLSFEIARLRIESPMELTLATVAAGGGLAAVAWYSVHLLAKAIRHPQDIGAWIPRVIAGWHKGQAEKDQARQAREEAEREREDQLAIREAAIRLRAAGQGLKELPATEATPTDAGEPPEDIVVAFTD